MTINNLWTPCQHNVAVNYTQNLKYKRAKTEITKCGLSTDEGPLKMATPSAFGGR